MLFCILLFFYDLFQCWHCLLFCVFLDFIFYSMQDHIYSKLFYKCILELKGTLTFLFQCGADHVKVQQKNPEGNYSTFNKNTIWKLEYNVNYVGTGMCSEQLLYHTSHWPKNYSYTGSTHPTIKLGMCWPCNTICQSSRSN